MSPGGVFGTLATWKCVPPTFPGSCEYNGPPGLYVCGIVSFGVRERHQTGSGLFMGILDVHGYLGCQQPKNIRFEDTQYPLGMVFGLAGARKPIPIFPPDSYYSNEFP